MFKFLGLSVVTPTFAPLKNGQERRGGNAGAR
jgi:hypothetical protein